MKCKLIGGFSVLLQLLLCLIALGTLFIKRRFFEQEPKRAPRIFAMDTAKQAFGWGSIHFANIFISMLFGRDVNSDPCVWYFLVQTAGLTIGTPLSYLLLKCTTKQALRCGVTSIQSSGFYGEPPQFSLWTKQVFHWVGIILIQRTLLGLSFAAFYNPLQDFGSWVLKPVANDDTAEIILVVVLWPPITAVAEFWIQDNFLKEGGGCYCCSPPQREHSEPKATGGNRQYEKLDRVGSSEVRTCLEVPMRTLSRMVSNGDGSAGSTDLDHSGLFEGRSASLSESLASSAPQDNQLTPQSTEQEKSAFSGDALDDHEVINLDAIPECLMAAAPTTDPPTHVA